jgi:hypothetical protein
MKRHLMRPNCSGYRGRSHQPTSGALGLCPTGVKKAPTVNRNPYPEVNVGSVVIVLPVEVDCRQAWVSCDGRGAHVAERWS